MFSLPQHADHDAVKPGMILRYNSQKQCYTVDVAALHPVGIVVVWNASRNLGTFQYDGIITFNATKVLPDFMSSTWTPWYVNIEQLNTLDMDAVGYAEACKKYERVGWILSTAQTRIRIQIDIE
ncbi:MAG: hypothetical protein CL678_00465 [Bdellovibrionaceae bacterium]|nr:hypothetical protein [Pseudobdellovibrionaceae bacterium]|tara:strand:- start:1343 stop:1714 length:372 start_codon:yes stop_codon:yes gene_type:complete